MKSFIVMAVAAIGMSIVATPSEARYSRQNIITCNQWGCSDTVQQTAQPRVKRHRVYDANGNYAVRKAKRHRHAARYMRIDKPQQYVEPRYSTDKLVTREAHERSVSVGIVKSRSGVAVRVHPSAQAALQCVVDYVEASGVRVKYMRGYGRGTVRGSLHPSGRAIDINQYARGRTRPHVPAHVSNAAADRCGVVSGARWAWNDNGHWNLGGGYVKHRHGKRYRVARRW